MRNIFIQFQDNLNSQECLMKVKQSFTDQTKHSYFPHVIYRLIGIGAVAQEVKKGKSIKIVSRNHLTNDRIPT